MTISIENRKFFPPRVFCAPLKGFLGIGYRRSSRETRVMELPGREKKFDDIFSRLDTIHQRDGRTDGLTDTGRQQRPRLRIASRGKKNYVIIIICHFNYKILTSHGILLSSSCDSLIFASVVARHVRLCRQEVERAGDKKSNVDFVNSTSLLVCIGHKEASNWMLLAVYSSAKIGP